MNSEGGPTMGMLKSRSLSMATAACLLASAPAAWGANLLAALPEPGGYISPIRVVVMLIMLIPWFMFCQWVDKDTAFLRRINREMWNGIVLGGGVVGLTLWLMMPWKTAGLFAA